MIQDGGCPRTNEPTKTVLRSRDLTQQGGRPSYQSHGQQASGCYASRPSTNPRLEQASAPFSHLMVLRACASPMPSSLA